MLRRHFKKISYLFLFPLFFILHGYNAYFGLIPVEVLFSLLIKYLLITLLLLAIPFCLLRNETKTFLFALFLLCVFFFFGAFHDTIKTFFPGNRLTSYSFILPSIAVTTIGLFYFLKRSQRNFQRVFRYSKLLLILFVSMEAGTLLYQIFTGKAEDNHLAVPIKELKPAKIPNENKPDIFFIVFDEYASSKSLKEDFDFDNGEIDSLFEANGFFVSYDSKSNYNFTSFSLASTFSLGKLKLGQDEILDDKKLLQSIKTIKQNSLVSFLKTEGYDIINYGCFDINNFPTKTFPFFDKGYLASTIDGQTILARIKRDIWWNFTMKNIFTSEIRIPESYKLVKQSHITRNKINYKGLLRESSTESHHPKFVYVHLMLPHAPFYLDANGNLNSDTSIILKNINHKQAYLGQLNYANRLLFEAIRLINKVPYSRPRVYIIEGDHGYRYFNDLDVGDKPFMNLNAYYFSDGDYKQVYNGISPVNTFRVVLNKYFKTSLPLLRDSSVYIIDPR